MNASDVPDVLRNAKIRRTTRPGPRALFRGKIRAPVSITLTPDHHMMVNAATMRLDLSKADLIGLLVEKYRLHGHDRWHLPERRTATESALWKTTHGPCLHQRTTDDLAIAGIWYESFVVPGRVAAAGLRFGRKSWRKAPA